MGYVLNGFSLLHPNRTLCAVKASNMSPNRPKTPNLLQSLHPTMRSTLSPPCKELKTPWVGYSVGANDVLILRSMTVWLFPVPIIPISMIKDRLTGGYCRRIQERILDTLQDLENWYREPQNWLYLSPRLARTVRIHTFCSTQQASLFLSF